MKPLHSIVCLLSIISLQVKAQQQPTKQSILHALLSSEKDTVKVTYQEGGQKAGDEIVISSLPTSVTVLSFTNPPSLLPLNATRKGPELTFGNNFYDILEASITNSKKPGEKLKDILFTANPNLKFIVQLKVASVKGETTTEKRNPLPEYNVSFVDDNFLTPAVPASLSDCQCPIIEYDPCCNRYKVLYGTTKKGKGNIRDETAKDFLWYHDRLSKNHGVVFLVKNFNTLKYDITVSNEFISIDTEMPELFNTIFTLSTSGGAGLAANDDLPDSLLKELSRLIKLNKDLKKFLDAKLSQTDCGGLDSFEAQKQSILAEIKKEFHPNGNLQTFLQPYLKEKADYLNTSKKTNAEFNEIVKEGYKLGITADSLVTQTQALLTTLVTTRFEYQYNVPQLQNADKISFTLNVKPKEGTNGSLFVTDQKIDVPIRGGWKVDFSTGFYYSSLANEKYALKQNISNKDTISTVVNEGEHNGKYTAGALALMHIYPRLGPLQPSFTFGVGKGIDLNYSLLLGGSLMFGRENRFGLSAGFNFSNVKVLSNKYNNISVNLPKGASTVDTYNTFKKGFFVSFTYSLGLKKSTQNATQTGAAQQPPAEEGDSTDKEDDTDKDKESSKEGEKDAKKKEEKKS